ncbi:hypothetical protein GKZ90_0009450 [Flavobacterium sp. MC2016-06]|jgi:hypothetical protein|uniref:hypothetical protein n=1 Tax=Flavobacterium sp. MC2016-06 TaxID=2676308 RepID=UPI0012BA5D71|nr:hypothetical protein [Flavobacterium sp. MC2016-06]MBU3859857.1 hypothetical protein [Flavobacterium sp. MC2016-06]
MSQITAQQIEHFLFNKDTGFLIKYHIRHGIDPVLLDKLYEILEELKTDWKYKENVPKDILYYLITIVPGLYQDLELYKDDEVKHYIYEELIYNLSVAIEMCLNPNPDDHPHFNTPFKEYGF